MSEMLAAIRESLVHKGSSGLEMRSLGVPWIQMSKAGRRVKRKTVVAVSAATFLVLIACEKYAPRPTGTVLPGTVKLMKGAYDIPYYIEPARNIELVLREVKLDKLKGEYSRFQPAELNNVVSAHQPRRVLAYWYAPRAEDIIDVSLDEAQVTNNYMVQICVGGPGCVNFYTRGEVMALEFDGEVEADAYAKDFLAFELSKQKYKDRPPPQESHGATFVERWLAFRRSGRYLYIVSSWTPGTMEAILTRLR